MVNKSLITYHLSLIHAIFMTHDIGDWLTPRSVSYLLTYANCKVSPIKTTDYDCSHTMPCRRWPEAFFVTPQINLSDYLLPPP